MSQHLIALYETKRQAFLFAYIQMPEKFSDALAYAYYHRVAPIFHENIARETYGADPFDEVYAVKSDFVEAVTKYVDELWRANNLKDVAFYALEEKFGGYKANRMELIYALEYTRIEGRFADEVWMAIENNAPSEANPLSHEFSSQDVYFG